MEGVRVRISLFPARVWVEGWKNQSLIASVCGLDDQVFKEFWVKEDLGRFSSRSRTVTDVWAEDQRFGSKLLSSLQREQMYSCGFLALYVMPSLLSLSLWKSTSHLLTSVRLYGNEKVKFCNRGGDITAFFAQSGGYLDLYTGHTGTKGA